MKVHVIICRSAGHIEAEMRSTADMLEALDIPYKVSHTQRRIVASTGSVWFIREDHEPQALLGLEVASFENRAREGATPRLLDTLRALAHRTRSAK